MTSISSTNPWIISQKSNPQASLRLFCFPFAGGSPPFFYKWKNKLPEKVALYAIQLPGRGLRLREAPITRLAVLVQALGEAILPYLDKRFAFFGHSIGALIAFELIRHLRRTSGPLPKRLFVSARRAPQVLDPRKPIHSLSDNEFLKEVERFKGTPPEILGDSELMKLMMPALRADVECAETYLYTKEAPLACPISVYGGLGDENVTREALEAWQEQTSGDFSLTMFPGGHFFIQQSQSLILRALAGDLT